MAALRSAGKGEPSRADRNGDALPDNVHAVALRRNRRNDSRSDWVRSLKSRWSAANEQGYGLFGGGRALGRAVVGRLGAARGEVSLQLRGVSTEAEASVGTGWSRVEAVSCGRALRPAHLQGQKFRIAPAWMIRGLL